MTDAVGDRRRLIMIGSGPAGYTAGRYTAAPILPHWSSKAVSSGALMTTTYVENFPGFAKGILWPTLLLGVLLVAAGAALLYLTSTSRRRRSAHR